MVLCQREVHFLAAVRRPLHAIANKEPKQQARHPFTCRTPSDREETIVGKIAFAPDHSCEAQSEAGTCLDQWPETVMGDERHGGFRERLGAVDRDATGKGPEHCSGKREMQDLTVPIARQVVEKDPSVNEIKRTARFTGAEQVIASFDAEVARFVEGNDAADFLRTIPAHAFDTGPAGGAIDGKSC